MSELVKPAAIVAEQQIDLLPVGICVVDRQLQIHSWNRTLANWTGIGREEAVGSSLLERYPHLKSARFLPRIQGVFESGQPVLFSPSTAHPFIPIAWNEEQPGDWMLQKTLIETLGDQKSYAQICLTDVTSHYRQTRALRTEKELHRISQSRTLAILETAADAIITITAEGLIESFNSAAERLFGYSAAEVLGQNINRLMPSPYRDEHDAHLARYAKTGEAHVVGSSRELSAVRKDGTTFPICLSVSEVTLQSNDTLDSTHLFTGIVRDLSEEKAREAELRNTLLKNEQLSDFGQILDRSLNEIYIADAASLQFVHVNHGAQENIGYTIEELRGMTPLDLKTEYTADSFAELIAPLRQGTVEKIEFTTTHRRKDGSQYPIEVRLQLDRLGKQSVLAAMILDITERQRIDAELQESRERALSADRSKSEFLANMSHEIRTPMTAILGYTDLLLDEATEEQAPTERVEFITTIKRNGTFLLGLINDILDLSKIEAGKVELELRHISPSSLVADIVSLMMVRANAKNLPFNVSFEGLIPETFYTDQTRLRQVLINVVGNAIKFTETGSVRIVTRLVQQHTECPQLQFDVIDSGIGIDTAALDNLFTPFCQADNSTTRKFGGTGLGLAISNRLVKLLGGRMSVASTVGEGSTFSITVPTGSLDGIRLLEDDPEAVREDDAAKRLPQTETPLRGYRVLLAEDGPDNQRFVSFVLRKAGADVTVAENGQIAMEEALAARANERPYHVILMDMQMPVLDGYSATRQLRDAEYSRPIIALTAHAMVSDRQKCLNAGCDDFMTKPIDRKQLIAGVLSYAQQSNILAAPAPTTNDNVTRAVPS